MQGGHAVHRTGVQVLGVESGGQRTRGGGFTRAGGAVDGDDQTAVRHVGNLCHSSTTLYRLASSEELRARREPGFCSPSWTVCSLVRTRRSTGKPASSSMRRTVFLRPSWKDRRVRDLRWKVVMMWTKMALAGSYCRAKS